MFTDLETDRVYVCHGHNSDGGIEYGTQSRVRVYCTCGVLMDSFRDNE